MIEDSRFLGNAAAWRDIVTTTDTTQVCLSQQLICLWRRFVLYSHFISVRFPFSSLECFSLPSTYSFVFASLFKPFYLLRLSSFISLFPFPITRTYFFFHCLFHFSCFLLKLGSCLFLSRFFSFPSLDIFLHSFYLHLLSSLP